MEIGLTNIIGAELYHSARKSYAGGLGSVVKKNRQVLRASFHGSPGVISSGGYKFDKPRDLFNIDYSVTDMQALMNFKVEAFTVAGVGVYELDKKLKDLAVDVWTNKGQSSKDFTDEARELILQYVPLDEVPPGGWLETNLDNAIGSSYHAAQWTRLQDPDIRELYPAYRYMTRNDTKVRAAHKELHGLIYYADDPIWSSIYPPNGWKCRCFIIILDTEELQQLAAQGNGLVQQLTDKDTRASIVNQLGLEKDFNRNPGMTMSIWDKWIDSKLKEIDVDEVYNNMVEYATQNMKPGDFTFSKDDLRTANDSLGNADPREMKDYDTDRLLLHAEDSTRSLLHPVIKTPDEVWGRSHKSDGVTGSEVYYIKYTADGVVVVKVVDAAITDVQTTTIEKANKYRKGFLIHKEF